MWEAPWHWVVLAIVVIALFGYKRLPDAARSLGRSLRIFKTEIKGMGEDDAARAAGPAQVVPPQTTPPQTTAPAEPQSPAPPPADTEVPASTSAKNDTAAGGQ
ncbi:MAG: twin-arginine translocase TatA/TatE family subunit [Pseudonocardiales bacterium]|nr:twin-arginine translocase TatA/TatE family subunit [Pseudonocardiales bacterium]